jgi:hypothetical protein
MLASRVRARAAGMPGEGEIRSMAERVMAAPGDDMSPEQIRALAATTIQQAQQVSALLSHLADLIGAGGAR